MSGESVNIFEVGFALNFLLPLLIGIFVFIKDRRSKVNKNFLYMSLCVSSWALFIFSYYNEHLHRYVLFSARTANLIALFIPVFFMHFALCLVDKDREKKKILNLSYSVNALVFVLAVIFPRHFVGSVNPMFGFAFYASEPGVLFNVFGLLFAVEAGYAIAQIMKVYPLVSGIKKNQIKYSILSSVIGFIFGSSTFIPVYGIELPPYPAIFMWIYAVILGFAIVRYRLFEIETVVHKTALWLLVSGSIFAPVILFIYFLRPFLTSMHALPLSILMTLMFFVFRYYYQFIQPRIDTVFRRRKYDYSQILGLLSMSLKGILDIKSLSRKVSDALKAELYLTKTGIIIRDIKSGKLVPFIEEGFENSVSFISSNDILVGYLKEKTYLETELVDVDPALFYLNDSPFYQYLKAEEVPLVLSLAHEEDFIGLILMGKRETLQHYTLKDIEILKNISTDISLYFYNALHHQDILEKQRLEQEIILAKNIQENLLPQEPPRISGISLYGLYIPSKEIGGDYYDFIYSQEEGKFYITIGDVSGKGLDAGLVTSSVKSSLLYLTRYNSSAKKILNILNRDLYASLSQQKFISLLLLQYVPMQGQIVYSSAGHERIIIHRAAVKDSNGKSQVEVVKSGGVVLGMLDDIEAYLEENTLTLNRGDKVLLYTDGSTEARNPREEFYGLDRLVESFRSHVHLPIKEVVQQVYADIQSFISTRDQYDDITLVGIEKE